MLVVYGICGGCVPASGVVVVPNAEVDFKHRLANTGVEFDAVAMVQVIVVYQNH
jgi:hypothetical protein